MTLPYLGPPAHFSVGTNLPPTRIVVHATVSPCVGGGARDVAAYFRTKAAGGSAHLVVDPSEVVRVAHDNVICWGAPPNTHSLHIELCDMQSGQAIRWANIAHAAMLELAAERVAAWCVEYNLPVHYLSVADLLAGKHGITSHDHVSRAWHQTTHTDPGPDFPWDEFILQVKLAMPKPAPIPPPPPPPPPPPAPVVIPVVVKPPTLWLHMPHPHSARHVEWTKKAQRHMHIKDDGVFGPVTRRHVRAYRRARKIRPYRVGVVGSRVWRSMGFK